MFFDPMWLVYVGPALLLGIFAQIKVKRAFAKFSKVPTSSGTSGFQAAAEILRAHGIHDVELETTPGRLSDHYDPIKKVLRLSPEVGEGRSLASVGIAAHEAGHALQHAEGYMPLKIRHAIFPAVAFADHTWFWLFVIGAFFAHIPWLATMGIYLFALVVFFRLVTLPVEFDASRRALALLTSQGIVTQQELPGAQKVLSAAAWTYVAGALMAVLQLVYLLARRD